MATCVRTPDAVASTEYTSVAIKMRHPCGLRLFKRLALRTPDCNYGSARLSIPVADVQSLRFLLGGRSRSILSAFQGPQGCPEASDLQFATAKEGAVLPGFHFLSGTY